MPTTQCVPKPWCQSRHGDCCHPAPVLFFQISHPSSPCKSAAAGRRCGGGVELAELIGDMKGHARSEIPLFREQTAAEIDFSPCLLEFLPPGADIKGLGWRLPAPECECNLLDAFITNRDRKLFPITRHFLPFFSPYLPPPPPLPSLSFFLPFLVLKRRALAAHCREPINSLLMAAPMPSHSSAGLLKSIRSFRDDLGGKEEEEEKNTKKAHLEARSYFHCLFPFCSLFAEDKDRRRLEVGSRQRRQMKSRETKESVFMKMP